MNKYVKHFDSLQFKNNMQFKTMDQILVKFSNNIVIKGTCIGIHNNGVAASIDLMDSKSKEVDSLKVVRKIYINNPDIVITKLSECNARNKKARN